MSAELFMHQIEPMQAKLFRLARRLLVSPDAAKDAVQDVMVKLWEKRSQLADKSNLEAFAMTVTKNHCYDQLKLKRNQNVSLTHENFEDEDKTIEEVIETQDEVKKLNNCIAALSVNYRTIIQLRDIEAYSFEDIAGIMEMSETNVRVTLSRARKALIKQMKTQQS
ncbi:RNA polymerase sigma factor [Psychroflexus sp. ALD_RP9]|nr:RNA polymerase sigma factor [Psychroflexus sp. ALD_RP9]